MEMETETEIKTEETAEKPKIAVLGGDLRHAVMARFLSADGYETAVYGMDTYAGERGENVTLAADIASAVNGAALVILPVPVTRDGERLCAPLTRKTVLLTEVFDALSAGQTVTGGSIGKTLYALAENKGIILSDYMIREPLCIANATPTAEGALAEAIRASPKTLRNAHCIVLGYGRVARVLSSSLCALGADVTVFARKETDRAWALAYGCHAKPFETLSQKPLACDVLFNTVPAPVVTANVLGNLPSDAVIIDLCAEPDTVDSSAAAARGIQVIRALSLPGKTAPVTAGKILYETVRQMLTERKRL